MDDTFAGIALIGTFRQFGPVGPVYEVVRLLRQHQGDWLFEITVVDSGETSEYPYLKILSDPIAQ